MLYNPPVSALPSVENLQCFEAAARLLNFRAAARSVALTPAAFGQRIKQLEDQLGARLFDRTTRSVRLTQAGLALVPAARVALSDVEGCVRAVRSDASSPPVDLVLGTRFELGMSWVVPSLSALSRAHPHVTIHLYFGSGPDLVRRLRTLEIDCAITSARTLDPKLDSVVLHEEKYAFVGAAKLLKRQPFTTADHAQAHTLLDIDSEMPLFRYAKDAPGFPEGLRFGAHRWLGLGAAMKQLVLAGEGVAVLPRYMVEAELKRGRLKRIFPRLKPLRDSFRMVYGRADARRVVYEQLAGTLRGLPIT